MLTKQELSYLKGMKRFSGMPLEQIEEELINLISSQKGFNLMHKRIKDLEKKLQASDKLLEKNKVELKRRDKEKFDLKHKINVSIPELKEKQTRSKCSPSANVSQLKRIMCLLSESEEPMNKNKIFKACGIINQQGLSAINFLVNHNLIKDNRGFYSK